MFATNLPGLTAAVLCVLIAACAGTSRTPVKTGQQQPPARDPAVAMIVPGGDNALANQLRQSLVERGWRLLRYTPAMAEGSKDYQTMARLARYRLTLSATRIGDCRHADSADREVSAQTASAGDQPSFLYNIAIIENAGGDVALAMSGASCLAPIVQRFASDLDQKRVLPALAGQDGAAR